MIKILFRCPVCQSELVEMKDTIFGDSDFYCNICKKKMEAEIYEEVKICPDCSKELAVIAVCGVDDYYCEECGKTVSKEKLKIEYKKI